MAKFPYERTEEEIANAGICENWTVAMIEAEREIIEICPDSGGYPMPEPRDQEKRDQYEADMMEIARDLDSQGSPPEKLPWYDYIMGAGFEMPSADTPPPSDSEMQDVQVLIDHAKNLIGALSVPDIEKILAAHKRRTRIQEVVDETAQVFVADAVANVIVNELVLKYECREEVMFMETGDVYRMQPFRLVDTEYKVVPKEVFMELIAQSETSNEVWTPNWND